MAPFDLVVVGSGPGGYTAAVHAAQKGGKVALIEEKSLGGTCLNTGCIPTKALLASVKLFSDINSKAKNLGINVEKAELELPKVVDRKDRVVKRLVLGLQNLFQQHKITVLTGKAILKADHKLYLGEKAIEFKKLIWATGSVPRSSPNIPFSQNVISSTEALALRERPDSLTIIGGGFIGVEFATFFSGLGTKVTVIEMLPEILSNVDAEAAQVVRTALERKGVKFILGSTVQSVQDSGSSVAVQVSNGESILADKALNVVGRTADLSGLEGSGIKLTEKNTVLVNERLETSLQDVYAIGDVTGISWLAHVAMYQGTIAAGNALGGKERTDYKAVPSCIFSDPEIALVGKSTAAADAGEKLVKTPLNHLGKMQADGENEGFIKMLIDEKTDQIAGVTLVGPHASDLLNEAILSIQFGLKTKALKKVIRPHPTLAEIYTEAFGQS